jgi:meiosis-specific protein HOP1
MGSPIPAPSSNKALSLPASDVASSTSATSTQEVDTQYLQDLLGMTNGVSAAADSEMLGTASI